MTGAKVEVWAPQAVSEFKQKNVAFPKWRICCFLRWIIIYERSVKTLTCCSMSALRVTSQDQLQMKNKSPCAAAFLFELFPWLFLKYFWPRFVGMKENGLVWSQEEEADDDGGWGRSFSVNISDFTSSHSGCEGPESQTQLDPTGGTWLSN